MQEFNLMLSVSSARRVLFVVALIMAVTGALSGASDLTSPTLEELLNRSGHFVQNLVEELAVVISDETYRQKVWFGSGRSARAFNRTIRSEMLFMWLPDEQMWLSIRNVLMVDGRSILDSKQRLERALNDRAPSLASRLRRLQAENSRFDLGSVRRTIGYPTLVLRFLMPSNQSRFTFTRAGAERIGGAAVWKLNFTEREGPTEIAFDGQDVLSAGAIWVRAEDGAVVRTHLKITSPTHTIISIGVDFQRDPKLELWVPLRMDERYQERVGQLTNCSARYSNFRRFETSSRIVTPK